MSNKSVLFDLLQAFPESLIDTAFPTLTPPTSFGSVEQAIISNAEASAEIVKFLNAFAGMKVRELFGATGMLSPAAQAIAGGFLQSDGTDISAATSVGEAIKMIGDDASGGGLTGQNESLTRRQSTGSVLALLSSAVALIPGVSAYSDFLSPVISLALDIYAKPGRIGETVGYIILDNICELLKEIIINELYPTEKPEGSPPLESESLKLIAERLRTTDSSGDEEDLPLGSLLQALQKRFAIRKAGAPRGSIDFPLGTRNEAQEEPDLAGDALELSAVNAARDEILEIDGQRVWLRAKVIDSP